MKIQLLTGTILDAEVDLVAIPVFGEPGKDALARSADDWLEGALSEMAEAEDFRGKTGQVVVTATRELLPARFVALVGAGERKDFDLAKTRDLAAHAVAAAKRRSASSLAIAVPVTGKKTADAVQLVTEGVLMGRYEFRKYRTKPNRKRTELTRLLIAPDRRHNAGKALTASQKRPLTTAIKRGEAVAAGVNRARDLINEPAEVMTPMQMAQIARQVAKGSKNLTVKILTPKECEKLGMNMFLAVGKGSEKEPRLIHLTYKPSGKPDKTIALVGKGVTFDSGGYSLKPTASMLDMKIDMSGAAAVIGAMEAIARIGSRHEVHAVTACAENLVSGSAYKLGDVLHAMDGTTVEINNTDAEGRLTLGDAIAYVRDKVDPDEIFDFATLTGACMIALGPYTAALFSAEDKLANAFLEASHIAGEDMWRMPLNQRLREQLKSNIADMRNTGERWGGAITAALFLQHFVKDTPWVHLDIAGPASASRPHGATPRGGTGFAVATIVEYATR